MNSEIRRPMCIVATTLLFFALVGADIAVVEGIFRPSSLWGAIWMWQIPYLTITIVAPLLVARLMRSHLPLYIPLLFAFGLEDTTFYSLQFKAPTYYVGVRILGIWQPSRTLVLLLNLLGVVLVAMIELFYRRISCIVPKLNGLRPPVSPQSRNQTKT